MGSYARITALLFLACMLTACAMPKKTVDLVSYYQCERDLELADIMPPDHIKDNKKPRVAVLEFADQSGAELGEMASDRFHNMTAQMGRFQVIERVQAQKLVQELGYQEEHGMDFEDFEKKYFALGKDVDYVILGSVTSVIPEVSQQPPRFNEKGQMTMNATCTAKADVSLQVRVIDLNTQTILQTFDMEGADTQTTPGVGCQITQGLVHKALEKAVDNGRVGLAETFPVFGYVKRTMTHSQNPQQRIAYISLGSDNGVAPGEEVLVMETQKCEDLVKKTIEIRYIDIAKGNVAVNGLTPAESILVIAEDPHALRVKVGNVVKITPGRQRAEASLGKMTDFLQDTIDKVGAASGL